MMPRFVPLPDEGFYFQSGAKPSCLTVNEVPPAVPDEDLKALVDALCTGTGLALGLGDGPVARPAYSKNYRELIRLAVKRDIVVPASMAKDAAKFGKAGSLKPAGAGIIDLA
jgi:hypothetical protein